EGGALDRTEAVTDETGTAQFQWTAGPGLENVLHASIAGGATTTATALGRPVLTAEAVVNAASFTPGLSPGGIATLFGLNLAGSSTAEVLLNGRRVEVFYSSTRQVNFHVPFSTTGTTAQIAVRAPGGESTPVQVPVAAI